jgi:hypothetical protein
LCRGNASSGAIRDRDGQVRSTLSPMALKIDCSPGHGGDPEPAAIWFGQRRVGVLEILDRWWGTGMRWWKVDTAEGPYVVRLDQHTGEWDLAAIPRSDGA